MSSNSKYIGLREVHRHRNEYRMGTAVEGGLEKEAAALGMQSTRGAAVGMGDSGRVSDGQSHAAAGCYGTKRRASLPAA